MRKIHLALAAVGLIGVVSAGVAQTIPGLDAEAIEKRAAEGSAATGAFVSGILARVGQQQSEAAQALADQAMQRLAAAPARPGPHDGDAAGDLDAMTASAGQVLGPKAGQGAPSFLAFASTAMPADSLQRLIADVSRAGGMVVFRGFRPEGSRAFLDLLRKAVSEGSDASAPAPHITIDPRLFRAFHIEAVPTYIAVSASFPLCDDLACTSAVPVGFDRIAGNVTTAYALQTFVDGKGPGAPVAARALHALEVSE